MAVLAALLALRLAAFGSAAAAEPFRLPVDEMLLHGLRVKERLSGKASDGTALSAFIFRAPKGSATVLKIYSARGGAPGLIYVHPAVGETQKFAALKPAGSFPDFFGDGAPAVVYASKNRVFGRSTLYVLRYQAPVFVRVGVFPEGRIEDLGHDGGKEIVSQDRPLGRFFTVRCGGFETTAAHAMATTVQRWNGHEFVSAGTLYSDFWREQEDRDVAALVAATSKQRQKPGIYLSRALTVYFDEAAQDRKKSGWRSCRAGCRNRPRRRPA